VDPWIEKLTPSASKAISPYELEPPKEPLNLEDVIIK
jgi:hypothetical protein